MSALDLDAIEEHLAWANGIDLDENVARRYRHDVPALLAELRAWRALGAMLPDVIRTASMNASSAAAEFNVSREDDAATAREYAALDALTSALEALS